MAHSKNKSSSTSPLLGGGMSLAPGAYPGKKYRLPKSGRGSAAPIVRRFCALMVDWLVCYGLALVFFNGNEWAILGLYTLLVIITLPLLGYTPGYWICGILLMDTSGNKPTFFRVIIRHALFCLIIPAVIYDPDRRGLHDHAGRTLVVRR